MNKCSCGRPYDVLNDKRLGTIEGLTYFNCTCRSTYTLTSNQLMALVLEKQTELAKEHAAKIEARITPERKEEKRRAWATAEFWLKTLFRGNV